MKEYVLMNKDISLLTFVAEESVAGYRLVERNRMAGEKLLPPKFSDINTWVSNRNYAKHKEHLRTWLREWGIDNPVGFLEITHALSLNDSLWVKSKDSELTWREVNLYTNEFTDVVSVTAFETGLRGLRLSTTSPEFTSEGSFEKCWIREAGGVYLYKKSSYGFANAGLEAYSEFYASQLAGRICKSFVDYDIVKFKKSIVSRCKMFTNEQEGFVPVYKYLDETKVYDYEELIAFFKELGMEEEFRRMIVLDAIIFNVDRHFGNFGFIVDNETFEILQFAPVFDHNMALLARAMQSDLENFEPYYNSIGHKIGGEFVSVARKLMTPTIREDVEKLREFAFVPDSQYNLPMERLEFLSEAVRGQVRGVLE